MKTMKNFILLLALTLGFAACEKDEDKIYLSSLEAGELVATESNVGWRCKGSTNKRAKASIGTSFCKKKEKL